MNDGLQYLPLLLLVVLFWFLVLRPARARQREFAALQTALAPGQQVMISSGIHGEVVSLGDATAELRIAPDVVVTVARQAIARIVEPVEPTTEVDQS